MLNAALSAACLMFAVVAELAALHAKSLDTATVLVFVAACCILGFVFFGGRATMARHARERGRG